MAKYKGVRWAQILTLMGKIAEDIAARATKTEVDEIKANSVYSIQGSTLVVPSTASISGSTLVLP